MEVECELEDKVGMQLKKKVISPPLASGYRPELDAMPEHDENNRASYFANLMGVMCWIIKLGWINIVVEVNLLAWFQASPREGHLEQMFHIFAYLKQYNWSSLVFDWMQPSLDESMFKECDWKEFYPGATEEATLDNIPEP